MQTTHILVGLIAGNRILLTTSSTNVIMILRFTPYSAPSARYKHPTLAHPSLETSRDINV